VIRSVERLIREAASDMSGDWSLIGSGNAPATHTGGVSFRSRRVTSILDREDGRYWPYYEFEYQLQAQRSVCRQLGTFTAIAVGALQALNVYVMGGDWEYKVMAKDADSTPAGLVDEVQRIVDEILEKNDFVGLLDNEVHDCSREDGDSLLAIYEAPDTICDIRRMDADVLRQPLGTGKLNRWLGLDWLTPSGKPAASWDFGVVTCYDERMKRIDHARPIGYHVVFDDGGTEYDFLPAWPMQGSDLSDRCGHLIKTPGIPRAAKRGWSAYLPVVVDLEREDKINTNMSVVTAVLSAIAWWEEYPEGTTRDKAESSIATAIDQFSQSLAANRKPGDTRNVQALRPGSVPKISAGRKLQPPPMGQRGSDVFIEARQAILRRIETRWLMPEYMITADASNANYASTLVSGTPFIKARESEQSTYARDFKQVILKALKFAHDAGRFRQFVGCWKDLTAAIDLIITPPAIATEDKKTLLEQLFGAFEIGAIDANEVRVGLRMEPKEELEGVSGTNNSAHPAPQPMAIGADGLPVLPSGFARKKQLESMAATALREIASRRKLSERKVKAT